MRSFDLPPERALAAALARDDLEAVGDLLAENLFLLLRTDWTGLLAAAERMPDEYLETHPVVAIVKEFGGAVRLRDGAINLEVQPAILSEHAAAAGVSDRTLDAVMLQEMLAHRFRADFPAARLVGEHLRERIARSDDRGRRPIHDLVAFSALHIGITEALAGDVDQALRDLADARTLRGTGGDQDIAGRDAMLKAAVLQAALGRLREAERLLAQAEGEPEPGGTFADFLAATASTTRALLAVERLDPRAPELIEEAAALNASDELWSLVLLASTRWAIATGDLVGALDAVDQAVALRPVPAGSLAAAIVTAARAQALTMMGEHTAAAELIEGSGDCGLRDASVVRVRIALRTEGPEAALVAASRIIVQPGIGPSTRAETMLLAAWAQEQLHGVPEPATVRPLGSLIAREGLWRLLELVPERVVAAIPGLDAAPPLEHRLAFPDVVARTRLTPNEHEVLQLLAGPDPLPAIARARFVTLNTVKSQVASIYRQLGVHRRSEAVAEARRRGLIDVPPSPAAGLR